MFAPKKLYGISLNDELKLENHKIPLSSFALLPKEKLEQMEKQCKNDGVDATLDFHRKLQSSRTYHTISMMQKQFSKMIRYKPAHIMKARLESEPEKNNKLMMALDLGELFYYPGKKWLTHIYSDNHIVGAILCDQDEIFIHTQIPLNLTGYVNAKVINIYSEAKLLMDCQLACDSLLICSYKLDTSTETVLKSQKSSIRIRKRCVLGGVIDTSEMELVADTLYANGNITAQQWLDVFANKGEFNHLLMVKKLLRFNLQNALICQSAHLHSAAYLTGACSDYQHHGEISTQYLGLDCNKFTATGQFSTSEKAVVNAQKIQMKDCSTWDFTGDIYLISNKSPDILCRFKQQDALAVNWREIINPNSLQDDDWFISTTEIRRLQRPSQSHYPPKASSASAKLAIVSMDTLTCNVICELQQATMALSALKELHFNGTIRQQVYPGYEENVSLFIDGKANVHVNSYCQVAGHVVVKSAATVSQDGFMDCAGRFEVEAENYHLADKSTLRARVIFADLANEFSAGLRNRLASQGITVFCKKYKLQSDVTSSTIDIKATESIEILAGRIQSQYQEYTSKTFKRAWGSWLQTKHLQINANKIQNDGIQSVLRSNTTASLDTSTTLTLPEISLEDCQRALSTQWDNTLATMDGIHWAVYDGINTLSKGEMRRPTTQQLKEFLKAHKPEIYHAILTVLSLISITNFGVVTLASRILLPLIGLAESCYHHHYCKPDKPVPVINTKQFSNEMHAELASIKDKNKNLEQNWMFSGNILQLGISVYNVYSNNFTVVATNTVWPIMQYLMNNAVGQVFSVRSTSMVSLGLQGTVGGLVNRQGLLDLSGRLQLGIYSNDTSAVSLRFDVTQFLLGSSNQSLIAAVGGNSWSASGGINWYTGYMAFVNPLSHVRTNWNVNSRYVHNWGENRFVQSRYRVHRQTNKSNLDFVVSDYDISDIDNQGSINSALSNGRIGNVTKLGDYTVDGGEIELPGYTLDKSDDFRSLKAHLTGGKLSNDGGNLEMDSTTVDNDGLDLKHNSRHKIRTSEINSKEFHYHPNSAAQVGSTIDDTTISFKKENGYHGRSVYYGRGSQFTVKCSSDGKGYVSQFGNKPQLDKFTLGLDTNKNLMIFCKSQEALQHIDSHRRLAMHMLIDDDLTNMKTLSANGDLTITAKNIHLKKAKGTSHGKLTFQAVDTYNDVGSTLEGHQGLTIKAGNKVIIKPEELRNSSWHWSWKKFAFVNRTDPQISKATYTSQNGSVTIHGNNLTDIKGADLQAKWFIFIDGQHMHVSPEVTRQTHSLYGMRALLAYTWGTKHHETAVGGSLKAGLGIVFWGHNLDLEGADQDALFTLSTAAHQYLHPLILNHDKQQRYFGLEKGSISATKEGIGSGNQNGGKIFWLTTPTRHQTIQRLTMNGMLCLQLGGNTRFEATTHRNQFFVLNLGYREQHYAVKLVNESSRLYLGMEVNAAPETIQLDDLSFSRKKIVQEQYLLPKSSVGSNLQEVLNETFCHAQGLSIGANTANGYHDIITLTMLRQQFVRQTTDFDSDNSHKRELLYREVVRNRLIPLPFDALLSLICAFQGQPRQQSIFCLQKPPPIDYQTSLKSQAAITIDETEENNIDDDVNNQLTNGDDEESVEIPHLFKKPIDPRQELFDKLFPTRSDDDYVCHLREEQPNLFFQFADFFTENVLAPEIKRSLENKGISISDQQARNIANGLKYSTIASASAALEVTEQIATIAGFIQRLHHGDVKVYRLFTEPDVLAEEFVNRHYGDDCVQELRQTRNPVKKAIIIAKYQVKNINHTIDTIKHESNNARAARFGRYSVNLIEVFQPFAAAKSSAVSSSKVLAPKTLTSLPRRKPVTLKNNPLALPAPATSPVKLSKCKDLVVAQSRPQLPVGASSAVKNAYLPSAAHTPSKPKALPAPPASLSTDALHLKPSEIKPHIPTRQYPMEKIVLSHETFLHLRYPEATQPFKNFLNELGRFSDIEINRRFTNRNWEAPYIGRVTHTIVVPAKRNFIRFFRPDTVIGASNKALQRQFQLFADKLNPTKLKQIGPFLTDPQLMMGLSPEQIRQRLALPNGAPVFCQLVQLMNPVVMRTGVINPIKLATGEILSGGGLQFEILNPVKVLTSDFIPLRDGIFQEMTLQMPVNITDVRTTNTMKS